MTDIGCEVLTPLTVADPDSRVAEVQDYLMGAFS